MQKKIKIFGERNTNTNYMSQLIELNLKVKEIYGNVPSKVMSLQEALPGNELVRDIYYYLTYARNLGWKHTCLKPHDELSKYKLVNNNLVILTITKNPYSWLLSLHRNPYHQYITDNPSFEDFLLRQWKTIGRDNVNTVLNNPMELWNIKNKSYIQPENNRLINITTESIFNDPEAIIQNISNQYSIERKTDKFVNYERSTKDKNKGSAYYRDFYLLEKWRDNLSADAIDIINESIDKELMSHFGYDILH